MVFRRIRSSSKEWKTQNSAVLLRLNRLSSPGQRPDLVIMNREENLSVDVAVQADQSMKLKEKTKQHKQLNKQTNNKH